MLIKILKKPKFQRAASAALCFCLILFAKTVPADVPASVPAENTPDAVLQEEQGAGPQEKQDPALQEEQDTGLPVIPEPEISAETAVLIDAASGRVLYDRRMDAHMYPASTTKIMTALIVLETMDPEEKITVSARAVSQEGSSIYLKDGEEILVKDLLYGMMLRSGNDAATAAAEGAAGSVEKFALLMNERAASLGLQNSNFTNPSGLQDENHYSTAYDLAMITREALKNDMFREIAAAKTYHAGREGADAYNYFCNKNKTVFQYEGATGVKIGYTMTAGRCLVASAEREGTELIAVVLNDHNWFEDAYRLMDYGFERFERVRLVPGQTPLTTAAVTGGDTDRVKIGAAYDITCIQTEEESGELRIVYDIPAETAAPVKRWDPAGKADIYSDEEYIFSEELYYLEDIGRAGS